MASSRVIVEAPLYDAFVERFVAKARAIKVGNPRDPATVIGPLIRLSQCDFIMRQVDDAVSKGARVCCGGSHHGPYFAATVLCDVTAAMSIYGEESFGPVTSVLRADDFEHALFLANDTRAGLSSAIVTDDLQKALDFALRSESGMVHINDTTISDEPHIDFGGVKDSGFGREGGMASIAQMTEVKWITIQMGKREFPF
jgi:aldehyde dehydrogenase (NAD+)